MKLPKYVVKDVTRSGAVRLRFKRTGFPKVRLPDDPASREFAKAYKVALTGKKPPVGEKRTRPGSIDQLIVSFYLSSIFTGLAESTRDSHRWRLEKFRNKYGTAPIGDLDAKHLHAMLAKLTPVNQKNWLKTIRLVYRHAIAIGLAERDPSQGYKLPKIKSVPYRRWEEEEIRQFELCHPVGTKARLALDLLRYTGLRKSDVVKLGPQHIRNGKITIKTQKTGERLSLPLEPELARTIAATKIIGATTFLVTKHGQPHTVKGFGNYMRDWCNEAGLPDLSAHGLRHAMGASMSENGATEREIMAVLGHRDPRMAMHYTRQASQARLAESAFSKMRRVGPNDPDS